ncbi:hypothetical protein SEA_GRECOETEREO_83 [Mycobacterium phage GrecoEtereo]|nr:hypothetical protein SEA_GRECOETEREO_83 [Mycobacterium phage GrecoEtereo]
MTTPDQEEREMTDNRLRVAAETLLQYNGVDPMTSNLVVGLIFDKFDVTEKPEPPAPFGTIRVEASSNGRSINVFISNGDGTWVQIFHDKGYGEGHLDWCAPWDDLPPGKEEVFRP